MTISQAIVLVGSAVLIFSVPALPGRVRADGGDPGLVHACLLPAGLVRIIAPDDACRPGETAFHWGLVGPSGPPGPGSGIPIAACQAITAPGSYTLTRNLTAGGDCLVVAADLVTIDLAGFAMLGNGTGRAITDNGAARQGLEVRNGAISNFVRGVDFAASSGVVVHRLRLTGNSDEAIRANQMAIVKDNILFKNGTGIRVDRLSIVTGNISGQNSQRGIGVGGGSTVVANTAGENSTEGLEIDNRSTILHNTARDNIGAGIRVFCPGNLIGNTAARNGINLAFDGEGCVTTDNLAAP